MRTAEVTRVGVCLVSRPQDDAPYDQSGFHLTRDEEWLRGVLPQWAALLTDWVEVLTDQVGSPEARDHQAPRSGDGLWIWMEHEGGWTEPRKTLQVTVKRGLDDGVWGRALDRESFEFALMQAAAGRAPAPPLGFLRDSKAALLSGQTNRAVLSAGLATELVLLPVHESLWLQVGPGKAGKAYREPTLWPLVKDLLDWGVALPENLKVRLVDPRNDAAHRATSIDEGRATEAVRAAGEVVAAHGPVPHRHESV